MKAYTDLEQSKKLAEILPLDSADMPYYYDKDNDVEIPCWSLAALLEMIPTTIEHRDKILQLRIDKGISDYNIWYYICEQGVASDIDIIADDMLDAAFEMVIWLKENGKI